MKANIEKQEINKQTKQTYVTLNIGGNLAILRLEEGLECVSIKYDEKSLPQFLVRSKSKK